MYILSESRIYIPIFLSRLLVFNCLKLDLPLFLLPFLSGKKWPVNWKFRRTIGKVSVLLEILAHHQKFSRCIRVAHLSNIRRIPMFLGLLHPDPLVRGTGPGSAPKCHGSSTTLIMSLMAIGFTRIFPGSLQSRICGLAQYQRPLSLHISGTIIAPHWLACH